MPRRRQGAPLLTDERTMTGVTILRETHANPNMSTANQPANGGGAPAFVVGVTGHMDLRPEDETELGERLKAVFAFLKAPALTPDGRDSPEWVALEGMLPPPPKEPGGKDSVEDGHRAGLEAWPGLRNTPVVVLSSLAPGADALVAEVALDQGFEVLAPLPFVASEYREASTFVREGDSRAANDARQRGFSDLLDKVGPENAFPVRLAGEEELAEEALAARHRQDRTASDPTARRRRYRAAGEFVASRCDLLLALWDEEADRETGPEACGTAAIVDARRRGFTPGLLPGITSFTWADTGPVLHVRVRRAKREAAAAVPAERGLRLLHPGAESTGPRAQGAQRRANDLFCRMAANLEEFNCTPVADLKKAGRRFEALLADTLRTEDASVRLLPSVAGVWERASAAVRHLEPRRFSVLPLAFLLSFGAGVVLHLFAHWHPRSGHAQGVQPVLGLVALAVAAVGLWRFWWCRSEREAERAHDWRALGEGLRVQLAWLAAGLGRPVIASYLQRQRNELEWIPRAMRSLMLRATGWRAAAMEWSPELRRQQWGRVKGVWLEGQQEFYKRTARKEKRELHVWHRLGGVLAIASVIVFGFLACSLLGGHGSMFTQQYPGLSGIVALGVTLLAGGVAGCRWRAAARLKPEARFKEHPLVFALKEWVREWVGEREPEEDAHCAPCEVRWRMWRSFLRHLWVAAPVAVLGLGATGWLADRFDWLPGCHHLTIVAGGVLLLAGGLAVAWSEKLLFSEHARQYTGMAGLFARAGLRMEGLLEAAEQDAAAGGARFETIRREVEGLLVELGHEALDEHAEWLILHRARPLEPVLHG